MISIDYLIIGGGPVGLAAAIAMKQRGLSVAVVDKCPLNAPFMSPGRAYAINQASQRLLTTLGVWARLPKEQLSPYEKMFVWDQYAELSFNCRERDASELGFFIEEHLLKQALYEEYGLNALPTLEAQSLIENESHVTLNAYDANGEAHHIKANFVLITDGATSTLRQQLGVPMTQWPYHHHATVATVQTEKPHHKTAYQIFTNEGPLAFLPLANPYLCSIVWSTSPAYAESLHAHTEEAFNEILGATFEHKLGMCKLVSERRQFPLHMRHVQQYHGKRWVLMGDAAHTIHPLAGLGLNLGLADLQTWLELTKKSSPNMAMLGAYQRQRKSETWVAIALMEMLKASFSVTSGPFPRLRGLGMKILNKFGALKRLMIDYACGK